MKLGLRLQLYARLAAVQVLNLFEQARYGVAFSPFSKSTLANPYPVHNRMREVHPLFYSPMWRGYWVSRFDWAQEILKDKRFGAEVRKYPERVRRITKMMSPERREIFNNPSMLDLDPPNHTRIRKLAQQGFIPKFIQGLEPRIRAVVADCLDHQDSKPVIDFIDALAAPLPVIIIAEMLGLPREHHDQFCRWSEQLVRGTATFDPDVIDESVRANIELINYFKKMIADKREHPGEDMLTMFIGAEEDGDRMSDLELYNTCLLLLAAGHETTTRLIGNGLYLLLQHPEQLQLLREEPARIPAAVEEMLRFEPPVQATRRFATEDIEFHGTRFRRGDVVFVSIPGANRDPLANANPDIFDITRDPCHLLSFGYGVHHCIGAALARLEAKVAFEEILNRFDDLSLTEQPQWGGNPFFRGLESLRVSVSRAPATVPGETAAG